VGNERLPLRALSLSAGGSPSTSSTCSRMPRERERWWVHDQARVSSLSPHIRCQARNRVLALPWATTRATLQDGQPCPATLFSGASPSIIPWCARFRTVRIPCRAPLTFGSRAVDLAWCRHSSSGQAGDIHLNRRRHNSGPNRLAWVWELGLVPTDCLQRLGCGACPLPGHDEPCDK
jgi:hypothetical protein